MNHMMENTWDREWIRETEKRVNARMMDMKNTGMEEKFPVSLIDMDCWEWPQGVGLYGMYRNYQNAILNRSRYILLCHWLHIAI